MATTDRTPSSPSTDPRASAAGTAAHGDANAGSLGRAGKGESRVTGTNAEQRGVDPATFRAATIFQRLDLTSPAPYTREEYRKKLLWMIVWACVYRFLPRPLARWRIRILRAFGARIADTVNLRPSARVWHPWLLTMGEHSCLADGVTIYNLGPVEIGSHTVISQNTYVCAGSHDYMKPQLPLTRPTIRIGSGVWVCAGAFIAPGVTIGDNAVVGAASCVTKDVPANMIVAGNPAVTVKVRPMPGVSASGGRAAGGPAAGGTEGGVA
jgi:putative colanic acid biosynthesis acetyltransferase WcaF